ncbi:MAG: S1 RNA-binding domain-containing protein [Patescibacteria group bacterium]|nr:S1 RNA-binding domain-containing protein [Patescibacteria group bacterium]
MSNDNDKTIKIKKTNGKVASEDQIDDNDKFEKLLGKNSFKIPQVGELITGAVISASKAEVKLDIEGIMTGIVRGPELYEEDDDYANLKPGDRVEATIIDEENENGDLELSFRFAGQEKAWSGLREAYKEKIPIKVKIVDANKGGLLVKYRQISGFLPVSQLAPENYPRVNGGDKGKILEKLKSFVNNEFSVKVVTLNEKEDKIIFSEKEVWNETQKDIISKYKVGTIVEGTITAITDFGVFVSFGENLEGLIHISELAWQRIDNPASLHKVGDIIKAEVISLENSKIFLSAKKLIKDPWTDVTKKYKIGQQVKGKVLKINPFGLFIKLDENIHGLGHISQLDLAPKQKINERFNIGDELIFEIVSIEPKDHRLGLAYSEEKQKQAIKDKEDVKAEPKKNAPKKKDKKNTKEKSTNDKKKKDKDEKKTAKKETKTQKPTKAKK